MYSIDYGIGNLVLTNTDLTLLKMADIDKVSVLVHHYYICHNYLTSHSEATDKKITGNCMVVVA